MIEWLFLDVDGTLTDGKIYIGNNGEIFKAFSVKDGCGLSDILPKYNIKPVIITARESPIVTQRCKELKIEYVFQGCRKKKDKILDFCCEQGLYLMENGKMPHIAYMGDDILDLECIQIAQVSGCPLDAVDEVKYVVDYVTKYKAGEGAVRDFIEFLVKGYKNITTKNNFDNYGL